MDVDIFHPEPRGSSPSRYLPTNFSFLNNGGEFFFLHARQCFRRGLKIPPENKLSRVIPLKLYALLNIYAPVPPESLRLKIPTISATFHPFLHPRIQHCRRRRQTFPRQGVITFTYFRVQIIRVWRWCEFVRELFRDAAHLVLVAPKVVVPCRRSIERFDHESDPSTSYAPRPSQRRYNMHRLIDTRPRQRSSIHESYLDRSTDVLGYRSRSIPIFFLYSGRVHIRCLSN